jgi:hypothetical protein
VEALSKNRQSFALRCSDRVNKIRAWHDLSLLEAYRCKAKQLQIVTATWPCSAPPATAYSLCKAKQLQIITATPRQGWARGAVIAGQNRQEGVQKWHACGAHLGNANKLAQTASVSCY